MATATLKTFTVKGFHCSGCSDNLGSALNNLDGVIRANADYEAGQVEVRFDPERVTEEDVKGQIRTSGFDPD
jgi:copper chaperone CopZ